MLVAQRRAEEALELERFKSTEREQAAIDLAQRTEDEWQRKYDSVRTRHAEDVASLVATTRELEAVRDELAATAQAKESALNQADELQEIANGKAEKVEVLTAELARLKSRLDTELENKAKEAAKVVERLESEASALRGELRKAKEFEEKLAKAERAVDGLKRAEADASRSAQEWKSKAGSLETRLEAASQLNKRNEESLASLTNSFEDCTSMLQDKQSQLLQLVSKVATLEKEASEYKERFLETSRRLEVAAEEACELRAATDGLRSEQQLLHEAHRQAVGAEKTASARVGHLTEGNNKLLMELANTREERDKAKKAIEDLAAALREVSSEASEAKERVLAKQAELDSAQLQMSELKAAMKNAEEMYQLRIGEPNYETECLRKTIERMGSEAKISKDDWVSKEAGFVDMLKRSDDGISSVQLEMNRLTESLRAAENQVQELGAHKTQLLSKLQEFEVQATNTEEEAKAESAHLKDLLSSKDKELLALNHELAELRLRESAALEKASEVSKLLREITARKAVVEESTDKSKALLTKLEMDSVLESLKATEGEAKAAKEEKAQLQNRLRLLESKITEANLTSEEAKVSSLRLKETLEDRERQLASIVQENREVRAREAAAQAKIDELATLLAQATTWKGGEPLNGAVTRSPEKQPSVLLKLICSPAHHNVRDDDGNNAEITQNQKEDIKHVEMETVRQAKHEKEGDVSLSASAVDANPLENSMIVEDDLSKERDEGSESSDDDDAESAGDDALVDQMNGLLIHGPTSSFSRDQQHVQKKKKRALLKKFGSLLKKKAHFTKLSSQSHS